MLREENMGWPFFSLSNCHKTPNSRLHESENDRRRWCEANFGWPSSSVVELRQSAQVEACRVLV